MKRRGRTTAFSNYLLWRVGPVKKQLIAIPGASPAGRAQAVRTVGQGAWNLDRIRPFVDNLIEETFRLIAAGRLMLSDDKTLLERMGIWRKPQEYGPEFRGRVEAEAVVLRKEWGMGSRS